jgi:hypothetical protein
VDSRRPAPRRGEPGMLTQGGQGGRPALLAARFHRIPSCFPLNLHAISTVCG